jgi:hypothetical protein
MEVVRIRSGRSQHSVRSGLHIAPTPVLSGNKCTKMLLVVVILKSLIELSLMFIVGRFLLGLLAGAKRDTNVFWQLLDVAAKPVLWITRQLSPKLILDRHIPLAAASWLLIAWVLVVKVKIDLCLQMGAAACQ